MLTAVAVLCLEEIENLDQIVDAPEGSNPPAICKIIVPRLSALLKKSYPEIQLVCIHSNECIVEKKSLLQQATACFVVDSHPQLLRDVHQHMSRGLRWVHSYLSGVDKLIPILKELKNGDISLADDPQFFLTNSKGGFSRSLAEWVVAASLFHIKNFPRFFATKAAKKWDRHIVGEIFGKTIGFIGFGDIASRSAEMLKPMGVKCLAVRRSGKKDDILDACYAFDDPQSIKVFQESDILVSSLPGTPETKNFVNEKCFAAMKPTSFFISIGRGTVVDEDALNKALVDGKIGGAAMDVFQQEPLPQSSPLWDAPNLVLTSHCVDWNLNFSAEDILRVFQANLDCFLQNPQSQTDMFTPCNKILGY